MVLEKMDFGSMKRKELQALCKKHNIPANLTNAEMAKRLKPLSSVEEKAGILKRSIEKTNEDLPDAEDRLPKKVRFDLETQISEFEKSEVKHSEIKTRGRRKSLISMENIVQSINGVTKEIDGKLTRGRRKSLISMENIVQSINGVTEEIDGKLTRGRRKSLISMENIVQSIHGVTKEMDGKKNVTDDVLKRKFHSSTDNAALDNRGSNGDQVATRRSLRNKKVDDDRMGEMDDLVKDSNKSVIDDEVEVKERGGEYLNAKPVKVSRRSKRNALNTEDSKSLTVRGSEIEVVEKGRPITVDMEAEDDNNMAAKEVISTGENLRRSKRHASRDETPVTLDNKIGETIGKKETRRSAVSANRNKKAEPEPVAEKPQKEKEIVNEIKKSEWPNVAAMNSTSEEVIYNEQCSSHSDQLMIPEKERPPVGGKNTRRSRRTATKHELPIILENVVAATNDRQEAGKQKKGYFNSVQEEDYTEVDHPSVIVGPVRRSARNSNINKEAAPEPIENGPLEKRGKSIKPRKEKNIRSKNPQIETYVPILEAKDSFPELEVIEKPSLYVESTRSKSESHDSVHEPLITLDNVDGDSDKGMEGANIQSIVSNDVQQEESVETDQTLIHESVGAALGLLKEIFFHEEKERLNDVLEMNYKSDAPVVVEASTLSQELTTEEHSMKDEPTLYGHLTTTGNAENMEFRNDDKTEVIFDDNIYNKKKLEKSSSIESYCRIENSTMEINTTKQTEHLEPMEIYPSDLVELKNDHMDSKLDTSPFDGKVAAAENASMSVESNKSKRVEHDLFVHSEILTDHFLNKNVAEGISEEIGLHEGMVRSEELQKIMEKPDTPSKIDANSFTEDLMNEKNSIKDEPTVYVQLSATEKAGSMSYDKNEAIIEDNMHKGEPENFSSLNSYRGIENSPTELRKHLQSMELYPSESMESLNGKSQVGDTSEIFNESGKCNVAYQSDDIDGHEDIKTWQMLFSGEQISSLTPHLDNVIQDNMISGTEKKGSLEQNGIESTLAAVSEKDPSSGLKKPSFTEDNCESEPLKCDDMNEVVYGAGHSALQPELDDNEESNNVINCVPTSSKSANLTSKKRDAFDDEKMYEIHRNINQEITWGEVETIEEYGCAGDQYNSSERFHESNVTVASVNISLTLPTDENVNDGYYSPKPADLVGPSHESKCIGFESGNFSLTGNKESLRDNFNLDSIDAKEDSGTFAEDEDYYGMQEQNQEMLGEFNKVGLYRDDDIVNGEKMDDSVNGGKGNDIVNGEKMDDSVNGGKGNDIVNGGKVNDIVDGAEPNMVPLASQVLAASTIGDWCADTEGHVSYDTNTKVEEDSHESIAIGIMEKHTDEPSENCFLVVALPAFVQPPEQNIGTPEVYVSNSVDSCIKDSDSCKQGKELSSLFATPVAISSAMKETHLYNHEGQISDAIITPVERTSARKDEQGEAGGLDTSMVDITTHDILEERSRQLDIQDLLDSQSDPADLSVSDHAFSLSPGFETACVDVFTNDTEMTSQETDVGLHASRKYEEMNEDEHDQEKDQIHSAEDNAELGIQNISDPQLTIRHGFMGLKDNNIAETTVFSDVLTPVGSSLHRTTLEDTKSKVSVESMEENIEGTNEDAFGKCSESVEQEETLTEKDEIHYAYLEGSIDKNHLLGLENNDVSDIKTFVNGQSPSTVTAHDTLQRGSLSFLETEDEVKKSDAVPAAAVAGREYAPLMVGRDDEGDSDVQVSAEVDERIVDPHYPICELSMGWKETNIDNTKVETAHDEAMQTDSPVKGAKMIAMLETELKKVEESEDNNGVGMEYIVSVEQEDNKENDGIHITEIHAKLDSQVLIEMEESSHTIDTSCFDLGSANAETMAWLDSGEEPVQVTDGYPAANTKYMASIEHEELEDKDEICSKGKNSDLNFLELEHESSNTEELKECYVADTVAMSSDLNSCAVKSSPRIEDDVLEDLLLEATINQVAFVGPVSVQVEEPDIASGASQELMELTETEHDKGTEFHMESMSEEKQAIEEGGNQITKTMKEVDGEGDIGNKNPQEADCKVESMSSVVRKKLIHGTPNKMQDMKENMVNSKLNVGNLTAVRAASKRPALKDLRN